MIYWKDINGTLNIPIVVGMLTEKGCNIPVKILKSWILTPEQEEERTINNMLIIHFDKHYAHKTIKDFFYSRKFNLNAWELKKLLLTVIGDVFPGNDYVIPDQPEKKSFYVNAEEVLLDEETDVA